MLVLIISNFSLKFIVILLHRPDKFQNFSKVLDLDTRSISISRNVIFHEHNFPFKEFVSVIDDFFSYIVLHNPIPYIHESHASSVPPPIASCSHPPHASSSGTETVRSDTATIPSNTDRPMRQTKALSYLSNYHCALLQSHSSYIPSHHTIPYPLAYVLSYKRLSPP